MIKLAKQAKELSTFIAIVDFFDENGQPSAPKTMTWSLSDARGDPINNRTQVPVAAPTASVAIVMTGLDLAILPSEDGRSVVARRLTVEVTYDSSLGNDLPAKEAATFDVENLVQVPA